MIPRLERQSPKRECVRSANAELRYRSSDCVFGGRESEVVKLQLAQAGHPWMARLSRQGAAGVTFPTGPAGAQVRES